MSTIPHSTKALLVRDIPLDVTDTLTRRAARNYRSVGGEIRAILTAVCRGEIAAPGVENGETLPAAADCGEVVAEDDGNAGEKGSDK